MKLLFDISYDQRETILFQRREASLNYSYLVWKVSIHICWSAFVLPKLTLYSCRFVASLTALFHMYFTFLPCRSFTVLQPQAGILWTGSAPPDQECLFLCRFAMCCVGRLVGVLQWLESVVKLWKQESRWMHLGRVWLKKTLFSKCKNLIPFYWVCS